jgi:hypothetical protein
MSVQDLNGELLEPLDLAAAALVEEAVVNALVAAETMTTVRPPGQGLARHRPRPALCGPRAATAACERKPGSRARGRVRQANVGFGR